MWILREIWKGEHWYAKTFMFYLYMKAQPLIYWYWMTGKYKGGKK